MEFVMGKITIQAANGMGVIAVCQLLTRPIVTAQHADVSSQSGSTQATQVRTPFFSSKKFDV